MSVRRHGALLALLCLSGCSCGDAEPPSALPPASVVPAEVPPEPVLRLPAAARTDLPSVVPSITITVEALSFAVSNRAVVETWPPAEREAVGRTRPLGDAAYPVVEREVHDGSSAPTVPGLHEAMSDVVAVEIARASIVHAASTGSGLVVRADVDVPFARVLAAIHAAAQLGLDEPRLALASAEGERELRLAPPPPDEAPGSALRAALASATGAAAAVDGHPVVTTVVLSETGLVVGRGEVTFATGCRDAAALGTPTIPSSALSRGAIDACFDALGPSAIVLRAPPAFRYADVVSVLEALSAHGNVSLATSME